MRGSRGTGRSSWAGGLLAAAALAGSVLVPGSEAEAGPPPSHQQQQQRPRATVDDGAVRLARRLALGSAAAPAPGVVSLAAQPAGVPLADGHRLAPGAGPRVLRTSTGGVGFAAVGISWRRDVGLGDVSLAVRTRPRAGKAWSAWTTTAYHGARNVMGRIGPGLIWTGDADALDVVLTGVSGRLPKDVTVDLLDPGSAEFTSLPAAARAPMRFGNGVVQVFGRSAWGASPAYLRTKPRYAAGVRAVVLHHTATTNDYRAEDVPRIIRSIYYYMSVTEKYGDIGYNVLVDKFGRLWEGRAGGVDRAVIGIHAGGFNTGTSGIAIIGNHDGRAVTAATREAIARYAAFKLGRYGIDPRSTQRLTGGPSTRFSRRTTVNVPAIAPHRTTSRTACPGEEGLAVLPGVRLRATALIRQYGVSRARH